jgi:hypothetical protein
MDNKNVTDLLITEKIADNTFRAAAIATGCKLWECVTNEEKVTRAKLYRNWRDSGIFGKRTQPCFEMAILGEDVPVHCNHDTSITIEFLENGVIKEQCTWACQRIYFTTVIFGITCECQPCGHSLAAIAGDETKYCTECAAAAQ